MPIKQSETRLRKGTAVILCLGALLSSGALLVSLAKTSAAQDLSWLSGPPVLVGDITYRPSGRGQNDSIRHCTPRSVWTAGQALSQEKCVVSSGVVSIDSQYQYIKIGNDRQYYPLNGMGTGSRPVYLYASSSDTYVIREGFGWGGHSGQLAIDSNILQSMTSMTNGMGIREYTYNVKPDFILQDSKGQIDIGKAGDISKNGRWLVVELFGKGLARIDLQNGYKTELFSDTKLPYYDGVYAWAEMAVSDDGKHVALSDRWAALRVYEINDGCTKPITPDQPLSVDGYEGCPSVSLHEAASAADDYYRYPFNLEFGDSGYELLLHTTWDDPALCANEQYGSCEVWRTVRAANYEPEDLQLDYLALGDSYSSGEGDTERDKETNRKYYRQYTDNEEDKNLDQPREKCHLSTRSYPYILSMGMALGDPVNDASTKWQSVACSGAEIFDMNNGMADGYMGQDKGGEAGNIPRLEGYDFISKKSGALNEFIPGRQQQIEFVKKYKPNVITLTIGGNDVGFADKIRECLQPGTCRLATEEGRSSLGEEIRNQYDELKSLYNTIFEASGEQSKIYVLGYPKFIKSGFDVSCGANTRFLDDKERAAIDASVTYLNLVMKQAARASGVYFLDIEDSLEGGMLCDEDQLYMTGITGLFGWNGNDIQESFHPNARGHHQIAMKVWEEVNSESLIDYDICPESPVNICADSSATKEAIPIPSYFQVTEPGYYIEYASDMTPGGTSKDVPLQVIRAPYSFAPGASVEFTLFSEPTKIGEYIAGEDGSLSVNLQIPHTVPAGYHTLVADGVTYSGEPIRYEHVVLIRGADADDMDENGIPDIYQPCGPFIIASGVDSDFDNIDDACDSQISERPEFYRMRRGDPSRIYSKKPESENDIFVERNVWANKFTGVEGDYDPDGDGWAVVGVRRESHIKVADAINSPISIDFEVVGDGTEDNPYYPVLYLSFENRECKAYIPTTLKVVSEKGVRKLRQHKASNDTCRQGLEGVRMSFKVSSIESRDMIRLTEPTRELTKQIDRRS